MLGHSARVESRVDSFRGDQSLPLGEIRKETDLRKIIGQVRTDMSQLWPSA